MRNFKIRKLSRENFIETYGVIPRSKANEGARGFSLKRHSMIQFRSKQSQEENDAVDSTCKPISCDDCLIDSKNVYHLQPITNNNNNNVKVPTYTSLLKSEQEDEDKVMEMEDHAKENTTPIKTSQKEITIAPKVQYKGPSNRRVRKFSLKKFPSTGDIHKAVTKKFKEGSEKSLSPEPKSNWLTSWPSQLSINKSSSKSISSAAASFLTPSKSSSSQSSRKASTFRIPAASFTNAAHKGYLDRRNKKKQWERFWCVLQDSCMYCYNSTQSEITQDAVVLRGYDVIADISNINRSTFPIRLERSGSPTFVFRCDSHRNFVVWVDTLKKDLARVSTEMSDNEVLVNSVKTTARQYRRGVSGQSMHQTTNENNNTIEKDFYKTNDKESLEMQKENLLREVLTQQQEILRDHTQISPDLARSISTSSDVISPRRRKSDVIGKYEREKDDQENKILKNLTFLNRRRNSIQIKVDQIAKQLAPRHTRNHTTTLFLTEMEARLEEFQKQLNDIDKEIDDQQSKRLDAAEKIKQKRDLELLILDQRESLEIVRRHQKEHFKNGYRGKLIPVIRTQSSPTFSGHSSRSHDHLTSIDEVSTVLSDETSSSGSSNEGLYLDKTVTPRRVPLGRALSSTPMHCRLSHSNTELHRVRMRKKKTNLTLDFGERRHSSEYKLSSTSTSDGDDLMSQSYCNVEGALSDEFRSLSTSSYSDVDMASSTDLESRRTSSCTTNTSDDKMEISASVLAEIEDFEVFSKMKLQKLTAGACG